MYSRLNTVARLVAADHRRQQVKAGLVYPDAGLTLALRPLLSAGQRLWYQAAMAASSRWVARTMGFLWTPAKRPQQSADV